MKLFKKILTILVSVNLLLVTCYLLPAGADEIDDIQKQIDDLAKQRQMSEQATVPLQAQVDAADAKIASIQKQINSHNQTIKNKNIELNNLNTEIEKKDGELSYQKDLFAKTVRASYIRGQTDLPLEIILSSEDAIGATRELAYHNAIADRDRGIILSISSELADLASKKQKAQELKAYLEKEKVRLASVQDQVNRESAFVRGEVNEAKKYQQDLSQQIESLTAKQQAILAAKNGSFVTSVGEVPLADDYNASPAFNPGFSPAFAGFSFGAFTHRKGMSQYGAKGRAESGQSANQILEAYYQKGVSSVDTSGNINVSGVGSIPFEDQYLMGIAEMPSSFHTEALRAQAIAARSYAYRYKQNGQAICTTEACQVYSSSKAANPPDAWRNAVNSTRGQVLLDVVTYYSSTTGAYVLPLGWDTTDGQGGPGFAGRAWESKAGSPWFYKSWYTQGYSVSSDKCGRSHPWLTQEEMADILNAYLVQNQPGVDNGRITPITTSCWGGNPYSADELRSLASSVGGGAVTSVSSASVSYSNDGTTSTVNFSTNRGTISASGSSFKQIFNLRAPGYISIKSPLFNIEKK